MEHALDLMVPASKNLKSPMEGPMGPTSPPWRALQAPLRTFQIFGCRVIPY